MHAQFVDSSRTAARAVLARREQGDGTAVAAIGFATLKESGLLFRSHRRGEAGESWCDRAGPPSTRVSPQARRIINQRGGRMSRPQLTSRSRWCRPRRVTTALYYYPPHVAEVPRLRSHSRPSDHPGEGRGPLERDRNAIFMPSACAACCRYARPLIAAWRVAARKIRVLGSA